jgi:hypothetical protein
VGPRTLRALALVSEVIYGTPASTRARSGVLRLRARRQGRHAVSRRSRHLRHSAAKAAPDRPRCVDTTLSRLLTLSHALVVACPGDRRLRVRPCQAIDTLRRAMARAQVDRSEKVDALKRLGRFARATEPSGVEAGGRPVPPRRRA